MKTIFGSALVTLPPSTTEYIRFNGETVAEWNGVSDWSDYVYSGGKRIARADNYEDELLTQGTSCSSCATYFRLKNGAGYLLSGYVIQSGDKLLVRQWQSSGVHGGVGLDFASGGNTLALGNRASDSNSNQWDYRSFDLSTMAGHTVSSAWVTTQSTPASGGWNINYQDFVLLSFDGTVHKLYSHDKSANLEIAGPPGPTYSVTHVPNLGNVTDQTTTFYHGDHLGSSRLLSNANGYPTWQGTYYPYGMEYTPPASTDNTATVNNYKFTGKERDTESGLDYFGARYYSSAMGRFMSPDWAAKATPIPYAKLDTPQSLNLYAYVGNNPLSHIDPDGHIDCSGTNAGGAGCQAIAKWNKDHGIDPSAKKSNFPGVPVKLPNGKTVPDPHSPTGVMMAPTSSVSDVAAAGKKAGQDAQRLDAQSIGGILFTVELGKAVGTGGRFDDQRMGPQSDVITGGFQQLPQFRDVSNFNVGLFSQQAGMTLDQTLQTAGEFAKHFSSNLSPNSPFGLAPQTAEFIKIGWQAGATQF